MISKNSKKLIISGIFFIIATVCYALYQILFCSYITGITGSSDIVEFHVIWGNIILTTICAIILVLYCFVLHKTKVGKKIYLFGCGAYALLNVYFILSADGYFDFYVISEILFLAITVLMIISKIKTNEGVSVTGTILFIIYALAQLIAVVNDRLDGFDFFVDSIVWLIYYVYLIAEFLAFFNLWLVEGGNLIFAKRQTSLTNTPLENDLVSLKKLLDDGAISEDEYSIKKADILNKL